MQKQVKARKKASKTSLGLNRFKQRKPKEVSFDDVITQLLELFDYLGLGTARLAKRATNRRSRPIVSKHIYPHLAAIGELLASWHQDPSSLDSSGQPLPLKMHGVRSFTALAKRAVPRIRPKLLLDELLRMGAVAVDSKKLVRVRSRSLPVYEDRKLAIQYTLTALEGFVRTLRHNLNSPPSNSDQLFHRVAGNGAFDVRDLPALKIRIKRDGERFLVSSDNWMARKMKSRKKNSKSKMAQVSIGVYLSVDGV